MKEIKTVNELMAHLEELKHNLTGAKPAVDVTEEQKKAKAAYNSAFWEHMYSGIPANTLRDGGDTAKGFLVPDTYEDKLTETLRAANFLRSIGKALANAEEDAFLNGDGVGKPTGIFDKTKCGESIGTLTAALKSDDILDLIYKLKRPYRKNASFIMNDATLAQIRKLKDNNGQYLWQPSYQANEPDKILGYNIRTSAFAPTDAIAFGDYKYYNIGDRGSRSFKQLNELFAGNGMIGYVAKERVDGLLILPEAVKILGLKSETTTTATK